MTIHKINGDTYLLIPLLSRECNPQIIHGELVCGWQDPDGETYPTTFIPLPKGNWQLIGLSDEINEEQASRLVEARLFEGMTKGGDYERDVMFKDYNGGHLSYYSALRSFQSLLQSHGITKAVLLKRIN